MQHASLLDDRCNSSYYCRSRNHIFNVICCSYIYHPRWHSKHYYHSRWHSKHHYHPRWHTKHHYYSRWLHYSKQRDNYSRWLHYSKQLFHYYYSRGLHHSKQRDHYSRRLHYPKQFHHHSKCHLSGISDNYYSEHFYYPEQHSDYWSSTIYYYFIRRIRMCYHTTMY